MRPHQTSGVSRGAGNKVAAQGGIIGVAVANDRLEVAVNVVPIPGKVTTWQQGHSLRLVAIDLGRNSSRGRTRLVASIGQSRQCCRSCCAAPRFFSLSRRLAVEVDPLLTVENRTATALSDTYSRRRPRAIRHCVAGEPLFTPEPVNHQGQIGWSLLREAALVQHRTCDEMTYPRHTRRNTRSCSYTRRPPASASL